VGRVLVFPSIFHSPLPPVWPDSHADEWLAYIYRDMEEKMSPSKTPKQRRAMFAAAKGKSKIGIPKSVGREFAKADRAKAHRKGGRGK
jgi:hypothetical protein